MDVAEKTFTEEDLRKEWIRSPTSKVLHLTVDANWKSKEQRPVLENIGYKNILIPARKEGKVTFLYNIDQPGQIVADVLDNEGGLSALRGMTLKNFPARSIRMLFYNKGSILDLEGEYTTEDYYGKSVIVPFSKAVQRGICGSLEVAIATQLVLEQVTGWSHLVLGTAERANGNKDYIAFNLVNTGGNEVQKWSILDTTRPPNRDGQSVYLARITGGGAIDELNVAPKDRGNMRYFVPELKEEFAAYAKDRLQHQEVMRNYRARQPAAQRDLVVDISPEMRL